MDKIIKLPEWQEPKNLNEAALLINQLGTDLHEHAYIVGKILIWVKKETDHGKFEEWIKKNVWFNERTARRFMGFAKKCDFLNQLLDYHPRKQLPKADTVSVLGLGQYQTIIIDPPWPQEKIERYERPYQEPALPYPTMTIQAIKETDLPAADDCHLFLWTTQKFLPVSFEILKEWEFKYILTMVWHKAGGPQPYGLPQYNCEFILYGRKGTPKFIDTKNFFCCFAGKRRQHSRKPKEFYDLIRRVTPGPRIDIFSREKIDGFESWGDEVGKY